MFALKSDSYPDSTTNPNYEDSSKKEQGYNEDFNEQDQDYGKRDKVSLEGCEPDPRDDIAMMALLDVRGGLSEYHE
jgi:hypothetical protein